MMCDHDVGHDAELATRLVGLFLVFSMPSVLRILSFSLLYSFFDTIPAGSVHPLVLWFTHTATSHLLSLQLHNTAPAVTYPTYPSGAGCVPDRESAVPCLLHEGPTPVPTACVRSTEDDEMTHPMCLGPIFGADPAFWRHAPVPTCPGLGHLAVGCQGPDILPGSAGWRIQKCHDGTGGRPRPVAAGGRQWVATCFG